MKNMDDASIVQAYMRGSSIRTYLSNSERDEEVQYVLQTFLTAGDEARAMNDLVRAERFYHETIKMATKEFDREIPEIALAKFHLSMLYLDREELVAAEAYAKSAVEVFIEVFGEEHPAVGMALHQLGEVRLAQHETEAASLQRRAAKILAKTYKEYLSNRVGAIGHSRHQEEHEQGHKNETDRSHEHGTGAGRGHLNQTFKNLRSEHSDYSKN